MALLHEDIDKFIFIT